MPKQINELANEFISEVKERVGRMSRGPKTPEDFNEYVSDAMRNIGNHLKSPNGKVEDLLNYPQNSNGRWANDLSNVRGSYSILYKLYSDLIDKEKSINRIETRAYTRALLFRVLTTLGIGFGIMFIYYLAHFWGIPMPLMRGLSSGI